MDEMEIKEIIAEALIKEENVAYIRLEGNSDGYHELNDVFICSLDHHGSVRALEDDEWRDFFILEVVEVRK